MAFRKQSFSKGYGTFDGSSLTAVKAMFRTDELARLDLAVTTEHCQSFALVSTLNYNHCAVSAHLKTLLRPALQQNEQASGEDEAVRRPLFRRLFSLRGQPHIDHPCVVCV
jgi:hypothetical protein